MPTLVENDALNVLKGVQAAADLFANRGEKYRDGDWKEAVSTIIHLRAAAIGWREVETTYNGFSLVPLDRAARRMMRHSADKMKRLAKSADRIADGLCRRFCVPTNNNPAIDYQTREFWRLFRDLHIKVQDFTLCWVIMVVSEAAEEIERNRLAMERNMPGGLRHNESVLETGRDAVKAFNSLTYAYREMREKFVDARRERFNAA